MRNTHDILLINQDEAFRERLVSDLQAAGYRVYTATEMRNALSVLSAHPVGLIVCDNDLDDIGGIEFLRFIKNDPLRDTIPVLFLVSLENQGRPFKAFELGAVDFLVYPLASETLLNRIKEAFPKAPAPPGGPPTIAGTAPARSVGENRTAAPHQPLRGASIRVAVSRDGVLWMPGELKSFTDQGIQVETSLFGKQGVSLMIRFQQAEGIFVINGRIDTITFNDFQKPAQIAIAVETNDTWRRIHGWLSRGVADGTGAIPVEQPPVPQPKAIGVQVEATIALPEIEKRPKEISGAELQQRAAQKKQSYDIRFYHSIIGKQLDNYRVITLIGAGSMGGVLQGWDVALEREVALKIISFELSSKEEFRELFIKEARVVSKLNHPNVALIYNIGCSNDILYYAMEFVDGLTLKDVIGKHRKLNFQKGLAILMTVCKTMEVVYQNSIVHRDIKPANIMITNTGAVKIVDFGVAHTRDLKPAGKQLIMGTPLYMSPEQIAGLTLDHRSDMYSLGATFYHALCGVPPFNAKAINDVLDQHLNASITPLWRRDAKIPPEFNRIIERMMAKDPNDRYQSFKEVADELAGLRSLSNPKPR